MPSADGYLGGISNLLSQGRAWAQGQSVRAMSLALVWPYLLHSLMHQGKRGQKGTLPQGGEIQENTVLPRDFFHTPLDMCALLFLCIVPMLEQYCDESQDVAKQRGWPCPASTEVVSLAPFLRSAGAVLYSRMREPDISPCEARRYAPRARAVVFVGPEAHREHPSVAVKAPEAAQKPE